ncbi:MAG: FAD-binding oxidoreductase [Kofleriaceae bacterium]|nr:FAD-binding oxidoreductase [Kofleriaceae bacterium]
MPGAKRVTVVGAGVIGLTAALIPRRPAGHDVTVVAAATGSPSTCTSAVAGAIWLPFQVGPPAAVTRCGARHRTWLAEALARTHARRRRRPPSSASSSTTASAVVGRTPSARSSG